MKHLSLKSLAGIFFVMLCCGLQNAFAQGITLPPSGDNQKSVVTQYIGLVEVTITYNSPDVTAPNGTSRKGEIWGKLVPYGLTDLGFGLRNPSPWRAGANENTTFTVSHDVMIEEQKLPAGTYGLHMIASTGKWTLIFSSNSTAWGSYFYEEKDNVLRVEVSPKQNEYTEWLTYDFTERMPNYAVCAMKWEEISVPFKISVPNINELYANQMRKELQSAAGFNWQSWVSAVNFCLSKNIHLEEALQWAETAISGAFVGQRNYTTLSTKARVLTALGRAQEAENAMDAALEHPTATPQQVHSYARQLVAQGQKTKALDVFKLNANKYPNQWPTNYGLARGYAANGDYKAALKYARLALANAPDEQNKKNLESDIEKLRAGQDIN